MQENIKSRTIFCHDNLDIMRGMNPESVDLIYLDPPFNTKKIFTAPIGSSAEGASFSDVFREEDVKDEWLLDIKEDYPIIHVLLNAVKDMEGRTSYNFCYLAYMAIRLIECHRILKDTGSLYLHCDPTMSHYLKLLLDCIFGEKRFRNEIIWSYQRWTGATKNFQKMHDIILFYAKNNNNFTMINEPYSDKSKHKGQRFTTTQKGAITGQEYINDNREKAMRDVWEISILNSQAKERTGYPTQKPIALLERIIKASSNKDDIVLDPFCGCATTCVAAERLGRKWIGIDVSQKAYELVKDRLAKEVESEGTLFHEELVTFQTTPPQRTDIGQDTQTKKYVYIISHQQYQGEYKVGIASDVKSRLSSYQTADPNRAYHLEYSFHTPYFRAVEKYIHEKYDNKHEWVSGALNDIIKDIETYQPNG